MLGDDEIERLVGPPSFRQQCEVAGDIAGLYRGEKVVLVLRPRYEVADRHSHRVIVASDFPPELWAEDLVEVLRWHVSDEAWHDWHKRSGRPARFERLAISDVRNCTRGPLDHTNDQVEIALEDGAVPAEVLAVLRAGYSDETADYAERAPGLRQVVTADLGLSLPELLRTWVQLSGGVISGLRELRRIVTTT